MVLPSGGQALDLEFLEDLVSHVVDHYRVDVVPFYLSAKEGVQRCSITKQVLKISGT